MLDNIRNDAIDNLVETYCYFIAYLFRLMYERIGAYTRKNLIHMYFDEERKFNNRVASLYKIYKHNIKKFNEIMQSDFKADFTPGKSLEIFKVFFRCQLPYEMFVSHIVT
jgi:hypothetical protein